MGVLTTGTWSQYLGGSSTGSLSHLAGWSRSVALSFPSLYFRDGSRSSLPKRASPAFACASRSFLYPRTWSRVYLWKRKKNGVNYALRVMFLSFMVLNIKRSSSFNVFKRYLQVNHCWFLEFSRSVLHGPDIAAELPCCHRLGRRCVFVAGSARVRAGGRAGGRENRLLTPPSRFLLSTVEAAVRRGD